MAKRSVTMPNLLVKGATTSVWNVEVDIGGAGQPLSSKLVEAGSGVALYAVVDAGARECGNGFHVSLAWYEPGSKTPARLDEIQRTGTTGSRLASWRSAGTDGRWYGRPLEAPRTVSAGVDGLTSLVRSIWRWMPCSASGEDASSGRARRLRGGQTS